MTDLLKKIVLSLAALTVASASGVAQDFPWQQPHAKVLPNGDLEYAPQPFEFQAGDSVRYIDFANGDDAAEGTREAPWKHHPWDADAQGNAAAAKTDVHTYVFKGGVEYRGSFQVPAEARGTAANPIRLTRDPSWGQGPAVINGAEIVTGWSKQSHPRIPEGEKVWAADVNFLTRNLWITSGHSTLTRWKTAIRV